MAGLRGSDRLLGLPLHGRVPMSAIPQDSGIPPPGRPFVPLPPPRTGSSAATVLVLTVGVVAVVGFAYGLWVAANSGRNIGTQHGFGATLRRSPDGMTWNITFTSVPTGLTPSSTSFYMMSADGTALLEGVPLSSLTGGYVPLTGSAGTLYLLYHAQLPSTLVAGDTLLIGTTINGPGTTTSGYSVELVANGIVLFQTYLQ